MVDTDVIHGQIGEHDCVNEVIKKDVINQSSHIDDTSSGKELDKHRRFSSRKIKMANIGVQCRRDKNLSKFVGFHSNQSESRTGSFQSRFGLQFPSVLDLERNAQRRELHQKCEPYIKKIDNLKIRLLKLRRKVEMWTVKKGSLKQEVSREGDESGYEETSAPTKDSSLGKYQKMLHESEKNLKKFTNKLEDIQKRRAKFYGELNSKKDEMDGKIETLMRVESYANGRGAKVLHIWQDDIDAFIKSQCCVEKESIAENDDEKQTNSDDSVLGERVNSLRDRIATRFLKEAFLETKNGEIVATTPSKSSDQKSDNLLSAVYCCAIVHGGASYLPDMLEYLNVHQKSMIVKSHAMISGFHQRQMYNTTIGEFVNKVSETHSHGVFRHGALDNISLVGTVHEETGGYLPNILAMLEQSPFIKMSMPWGELSQLRGMAPTHSNDGPILWIRPGEQTISSNLSSNNGNPGSGHSGGGGAHTSGNGSSGGGVNGGGNGLGSPHKRRRNANELENLKYLPRCSSDREWLFEDRTNAHADHIGFGLDRQTTAAVGVLKGVFPQTSDGRFIGFGGSQTPRVDAGRDSDISSSDEEEIDGQKVNGMDAQSGSSDDALDVLKDQMKDKGKVREETSMSSSREVESRGATFDNTNNSFVDSSHSKLIGKETVIFHAADFHKLVAKLQLDLHEPPVSQCNMWLEDGKLNQLVSELNIRYAKVPLRHDDIYFLPRNIIHQFKTVSATTSMAWHVRLQQYHKEEPSEEKKSAESNTNMSKITSASQKSTVSTKESQKCKHVQGGVSEKSKNQHSVKRKMISHKSKRRNSSNPSDSEQFEESGVDKSSTTKLAKKMDIDRKRVRKDCSEERRNAHKLFPTRLQPPTPPSTTEPHTVSSSIKDTNAKSSKALTPTPKMAFLPPPPPKSHVDLTPYRRESSNKQLLHSIISDVDATQSRSENKSDEDVISTHDRINIDQKMVIEKEKIGIEHRTSGVGDPHSNPHVKCLFGTTEKSVSTNNVNLMASILQDMDKKK